MKYYSIHGIIGVSVEEAYLWMDTLNNDLPVVFKSTKEAYESCQFFLNIRYSSHKISTPNKKRLFSEKSYFIDQIYGVKIDINGNRIELICCQECNEWFMFLLYYLFSKAGFLFIHAAALEKDGRVIIIPSAGGTGKTILSLYLLKNENYKLLGDDLCLVNNKGVVLSYPKKMVIYPWHTEFVNEEVFHPRKSLIRISQRRKEIVKLWLRRYPKLLAFIRRRNPQLNQVNPVDFLGFDPLISKGTLSKIIFLERKELEQIYSYDEIAIKTFTTTRHELFHYFSEIIEDLICNHSVIEGRYIFSTPLGILDSLKKLVQWDVAAIPQDVSNKLFINKFLIKL